MHVWIWLSSKCAGRQVALFDVRVLLADFARIQFGGEHFKTINNALSIDSGGKVIIYIM
jgi:hypothetical protein